MKQIPRSARNDKSLDISVSESESQLADKMAQKNANTNRRLFILAGFFAFWFLVICVRLVCLQVVNYGDYSQRAARQQQRSIEVSPVRGNIYDRRGNELAMTVQVDSVFAVPSEIPDVHSTAQILGRIVKADPGEIENR